MKTHAFNNGDHMPMLGLGTWKSEPGDVGAAVREALEAGYRHIDCAPIYQNEAEVGEAFAATFESGQLKRKDVWVTSKLWSNCHEPKRVLPALKKTLRDLRLDFLDLYLIHWPVAFRHDVVRPKKAEDFFTPEELPIESTWEAMMEAVDRGLCRHIGVSNFSPALIKRLIEMGGMRPEVLQVELHPYLPQNDLLTFCESHEIFVTAYSPLGSPDRPESMRGRSEPTLLDNEVLREIAQAHDASPAQILIRWAIERGTSVIPKSANPKRIQENLAAAALELGPEDMGRLAELDLGFRYVNGKFWENAGSPYRAEEIFGSP